MEAEDVEPDEAPPVAPLDDVDETPVAPPVEAGVPADTPLVADDAPVLPAFDTDDAPAPWLVPVVVVAVKAVAVVADWICMESLVWLETVHGGFGAGWQSPETCPITGLSSR